MNFKFKFVDLFSSLLEYILVFLVIISCNTPYSQSITKDFHIAKMIVCVSVLLFMCVFTKLMNSKYFNVKRMLVIWIIYFFLMMIYVAVGVQMNRMQQFASRYLIVIPLLSLYIIVQKNKAYDLLRKFSNVMVVLSLISLFLWYFGSLLKIIRPTGSIYALWGENYTYPSYYGLYFERQRDDFIFGKNVFRNQGIFCEAPMHSLCLIIALAIEILLLKEVLSNKSVIVKFSNTRGFNLIGKYRFIHIIILVVTLITTTSTTGLILLPLILVMEYFISNPKGKYIKILKMLIGVLVVIVAFKFVYEVFTDKATSASWKTRVDDLNAGYMAWKNHIFLGNGYGSYAVQNYMDKRLRGNNLGFSNSVFSILSQGGLLLFTVYAFAFGSYFAYGIRNKNKGILAFGTIVVIEFIFTMWQSTFLMMFLLAIGYSFLMYKPVNIGNDYFTRSSYKKLYLKKNI